MTDQPSMAPAPLPSQPAARPFRRWAWAVAPALVLLTACGGGGGGDGAGGGAGEDAAPLLALTEANAKAGAYSAIINLNNPGPEGGAQVVIAGTKAQPADAGKLGPATQLVLSLARLAAGAKRGGSTKVAVDDSVACAGGGTVRAEGEMAAPPELSTGDRLTLVTANCKPDVNSRELVNGRVTVAVHALGAAATDISFEYDRFSIGSGDFSIDMTGDTRLRTSGRSSMQLTGTRLSLSATQGADTTLLRWHDYRLATEAIDGAKHRSLAARVETLDPRLGTGWVGYTLSTPSPVLDDLVDGALRLQGQQGSALLVQFSDDGKVTLQLDADGNGSYERTSTYTTVQQLATQ